MKNQVRLIALLFYVSAVSQADIQTRIVGGSNAPANQYSYQVSLVFSQAPGNFQGHFCGGTLFNNTTVITAAHCVYFLTNPNQVAVLVGTKNLNQGGARIPVSQIIIHQSFDKKTRKFDIALLKLAPSKRAQKDLLARTAKAVLATSEPAAGIKAWVSGWGTLKEGQQDGPSLLQHAEVNMISRDVCNAKESYDGAVGSEMVCAGLSQGGRDACQGDSGGPLVVEDTKKKRNVLVGVVSWGNGCARAGYPGVYSNVASLRTWILNNSR